MTNIRFPRTVAIPTAVLALAACSEPTATSVAPDAADAARPSAAVASQNAPTVAGAPRRGASFDAIHRIDVPASAAASQAALVVAGAAPGTLVRSIEQPGAFGNNCPSGVNVGLAFNGTHLIMSCYNTNKLDLLRTSDASLVKQLTVQGLSDIDALAWDAKQNRLWACTNFNDVTLIDTSDPDGDGIITNAEWETKFASGGCFDGLAFDGSDNTLYASPDASRNFYHYQTNGAQISYTFLGNNLTGSCGNSGIAAGGGNLYLANNGCQEIWKVNKALTSGTFFASFPQRIEDLECDDITFRGDGISVIWQQDAYDRKIQAYAIEPNACPFGGLAVPRVVMDAQPGRISVASSPVVNVVLISNALFDATAVNLANVRFVVNGNTAAAASVSMRGGAYISSTRDFNGDGLVDRMVVFNMAALRAAGLVAGTTNFVVQDVLSATGKFEATDTVLPTFVP